MSNLYDDDLHDEQDPYLYDHDPETAEPYEDGYEDGYEEGYDDGYEEGYDDGCEEGMEGHGHNRHLPAPPPAAGPNGSGCIVIVALIVLMSLIGC